MAYTKRDKNSFIKELQKFPIVGDVCRKLEIGRATYYRWRIKDPEFAAQCDEALRQSTDAVSDLAESRLVTAIGEGDMKAITFWLTRRNRNYIDPIKQIDLEIRKEQLRQIKKADEEARVGGDELRKAMTTIQEQAHTIDSLRSGGTDNDQEDILREHIDLLRRAVSVAEMEARAQDRREQESKSIID